MFMLWTPIHLSFQCGSSDDELSLEEDSKAEGEHREGTALVLIWWK